MNIGGKVFSIKVSKNNFNSTVYSSDNLGANWTKEISFPTVVSELYLLDNHLWVLAKNPNGIFQFYVSNDFGKSWDIAETITYL